jgi:colanic acid/amylovoran biosynthesis glycosyltransferase
MQPRALSVGYVLRYWPTVSETFVARELEELLRRGISAEVVALGQRSDARLAPGSPVRSLAPPRGRGALALLPPLAALSRAEARAAARWASRHLRPRDVARALWVAEQGARRGWTRLHVHFAGEAAEWARVAAIVLGVPYTVTVHAVDLFVPRPSLREVLRDASRVITVCEHHRRWLSERYAVEASVIRCGVPTDVPLAEPGQPGARFVCVARDVPKKGLDELVAALRELPSATLRLVSDGVRLGGPRVLAGPLPPQQVPAVLARSHAFVLPCRVAPDGDQDGVPVALIEAMAAGLPVVSTPVSGIGELVDGEVGWLVPPGDHDALVAALREASCPEERARRGAAARQRVISERWTVGRQVDELLAVWV